MDDHRSSGPGGRADDQPVGKRRPPDPDPAYDWGGKPGEDFGPMPAPPGASPPGPASPSPGPAPWPPPAADSWSTERAAPDPGRETPDGLRQPAEPERSSGWPAPADDTAPRPRQEPRDPDASRPPDWTRATPNPHSTPDPWDDPGARYDPHTPLDVDVDAATSVRRSVGRGTVPMAARHRRRRPLAGLLALLVVLGVLVGVVLAALSRLNAPATQTAPVAQSPGPAAASPGTGSGPAILPIATATVVQAGSSPVLTYTPDAVVLDEPTPAVAATPVASPSPAAATLTPVTPRPPSGSPLPGTPRRGTPTPRSIVPAVIPTPPALVTPPSGARFPTPTPARVAGPTRTPPAVPTVRPITFTTRIWSERTLHSQGDDASICAQATTGASAEIFVLGPDRSNRALGEFTPPAERVCTTIKLDAVGLYVLTLIIKDANGNETDRQSAALYVSQ